MCLTGKSFQVHLTHFDEQTDNLGRPVTLIHYDVTTRTQPGEQLRDPDDVQLTRGLVQLLMFPTCKICTSQKVHPYFSAC